MPNRGSLGHRPLRRARPRAFEGFAAGGSITLVVLLVVPATSLATTTAVQFHAPYQGYLHGFQLVQTSGCHASATVRHNWTFNLTTGDGQGSWYGRAGGCVSPTGPWAPTHSAAAIDGAYSAGIQLTPASGRASNLTAQLGGNLSIRLSASDGSSGPACPSGPPVTSVNDTIWEWNLTYTGGRRHFADFAYNYQDYANGNWSNESNASAPIPSPFPLNNTTYYSHYENQTFERSCLAVVRVYVLMSAALVLTNPPEYVADQYGGGPNPYAAFPNNNMYVIGLQVSNSSSWSWSEGREWDGPHSLNLTEPFSIYSSNDTISSERFYAPVNSSTSYHWATEGNDSPRWVVSYALSGVTLDFPGPFNLSRLQALGILFEIDASATVQNWRHGSASFEVGAPASTHDLEVRSIRSR